MDNFYQVFISECWFKLFMFNCVEKFDDVQIRKLNSVVKIMILMREFVMNYENLVVIKDCRELKEN